MLDPDLVLTAVVNALNSIAEVQAALGLLPNGDQNLVTGHFYLSGAENSLARSLYEMATPGVLVAYMDMLGGNFSADQIWKHRLEIWLRPKNASSVSTPGCSAPHLWYLLMNKAVTSIPPNTLNFRNIRIMSGLNPCDAMPHMVHRQAEDQSDFFMGNIVLPEWGDQP